MRPAARLRAVTALDLMALVTLFGRRWTRWVPGLRTSRCCSPLCR